MDQPKFKPGQQWLSRDGEHKFHIMTVGDNYVNGVFIAGNCIGMKLWFYTDNGRFWHNIESEHDLVTLIKDVE